MGFQAPRAHAFAGGIDIVYLWVNGSDERFARRLFMALRLAGLRYSTSQIADRWNEKGELRYSLRAVEQFAPWARCVHIVTDGQIPSWIRTDHPKVRFINHSVLFGRPFHSYNPDAIHFALSAIPSLSRRFVLMDDDYIFMRPVTPADFFDPLGRSIIHGFFRAVPAAERLATQMAACSNESTAAIYNLAMSLSRTAIAAMFNVSRVPAFLHIPIAVDVEVLNTLNRDFDTQFIKDHVFRTCGDWQFQSLYIGYSWNIRRSVMVNTDWMSVPNKVPARSMTLISRSPKLACINDWNPDVLRLMHEKFPQASSFEKESNLQKPQVA